MLTVYKASAGSGKTFQLVVEYLKLLLKNPFNYKHILAVTFTNKATNEMKTRILEQLDLLAGNQESAYLTVLQNNNLSEKEIRDKARLVLKNILHDYNRFSIKTIDSFTQKIIKSFNRELGISPNFTVELDSDIILDEAVDRMLAKIDKDKKLLKWLKEYSKEKIEDNLSQRIDDDVKKLGKELFKENFQIFFPEESKSVYNRENLDSFGKELNKIKKQFETELKKYGKTGVELIEKNGLSIDDFSGKGRGIGAIFSKYAIGNQPNITPTVRNAAENIEKWYTKTSSKQIEIHSIVESDLQPLLATILTYFDTESRNYFTATVILKQLRILGILSNLKEEIKTLLHEKGILQISDSNLLLSKIIGQSDSPYIYEKTGNHYNHFMLDEFQDTSILQWNNFKPLVVNSLAEGNKNLIVGDVKQSIYRWRNSDWKILAEQLNSDFSEAQISNKTLLKNWRSDTNIIDFNNAIFDSLKETIINTLLKEIDNEQEVYINKFRNIYDSFIQKPGQPEADIQGFVKVQFFDEKEFKKESAKVLVEQVKLLQDQGIKASEIAILIRTNKEGTSIVQEFLRAAAKVENQTYNLSLLSNESLFLHSSKGVLFVMNTIELLIDSQNEIAKVALLNLWIDWLKPELQRRNKFINNEINNQIQIDFSSNTQLQIDEHFKALFETELETRLAHVKEKILLASLDESITLICSQLELFEIESELPFLQTLIDKSGELKTSFSNDLSNLLFWWNEKGFLTSVNVNDEVDSIRLLTVHKSKGLEYKAILLPYLDWKTSWSGHTAPLLWCRPQEKPFNQFPLLPVRAGIQMEKSYFQNEFYEEKLNNIIDSFNLIYVAFTRAKTALFINCPTPGKSGKSMPHLLKNSLETLSIKNEFTKSWNDEKSIFQFGFLPKSSDNKTRSDSVIIKKYKFNDFSEKIKLRTSGDDFLIEGEKHCSVKNTGKIIHDILSEIVTRNDIEKACLKALKNKLVNQEEFLEIKQKLQKSILEPEISSWFNGSYTVINERSLLTSERILRPDRIMIAENEALVVDYKTGFKKSESYNRQVKLYAKTLKETGYKKVIGFLWYINKNEVEKVCEF